MRAAHAIVAMLALNAAAYGTAAAQDPSCAPTPLPGCHQPRAEKKAKLILKRKDGEHDKLVWKWSKGEATTLADFGDPVHSTTYTLCVYDQSGGVPALKIQAVI